MKKGLLYIFALSFCLLVLEGCKRSTDITRIVEIYCEKENLTFDSKWNVCYIIPGGGCSTCIASGFTFLFANKKDFSKEQNENVVVFTSVRSKKLLMRNLGNHKLDDFNYILDSSDEYLLDSKDNKYPLVIYLEQGKIKRAESQSPGSNALNNLESYFRKY